MCLKSSDRKKETAMTNGIVAIEANLASCGLMSSKSIGDKGKKTSLSATETFRRDTGIGRRGRAGDRALLRGLLDRKSSSLSLAALARAAAISGKRLVLEIRDENPVRIVRTSTRGM